MNMYLLFVLISVALSERSLAEETLTEEEKCFAQEKVLYEPTKSCHKLLTKGPCASDEIFVLEKPREGARSESEIKIKSVCVKEKCGNRQIFWSKNSTCIALSPQTRIELCGTSSNEELLSNVFGEAECVCQRNPPSGRLNGDKKNACYELYTQGPCRKGQILGFPDTNESGLDSEQAECINDPCYRDKTTRPGTKPKNVNLAAWEDGKCYELGTRGPCDETFTFKVHSIFKRPVCSNLYNQIFVSSKNCFTDENGVCQKKFNFNSKRSASKFENELIENINALRKKRHTKI